MILIPYIEESTYSAYNFDAVLTERRDKMWWQGSRPLLRHIQALETYALNDIAINIILFEDDFRKLGNRYEHFPDPNATQTWSCELSYLEAFRLQFERVQFILMDSKLRNCETSDIFASVLRAYTIAVPLVHQELVRVAKMFVEDESWILKDWVEDGSWPGWHLKVNVIRMAKEKNYGASRLQALGSHFRWQGVNAAPGSGRWVVKVDFQKAGKKHSGPSQNFPWESSTSQS
ncbi:uncharacterized protein BDR25DRAFT_305266 [Lindgomyces ingoldianus]|uniref:Uncharacterized protein n=1 Tax=Lindgomyces ingoldianus TaxID=673940 RepID=A0ACB6QLK4_9PLEO|nr:uncharacterized protein BDR25DRAFT_305266 [Lindgomyces ingoldianus]KAF2467775.1 hypothetical protein BDR25DRAFT_305266 [Lindgomyces ingoldianus]